MTETEFTVFRYPKNKSAVMECKLTVPHRNSLRWVFGR
jgi:hypothetical protein